jgi:Ser-tRNA(Ala) deacylase AlaX
MWRDKTGEEELRVEESEVWHVVARDAEQNEVGDKIRCLGKG